MPLVFHSFLLPLESSFPPSSPRSSLSLSLLCICPFRDLNIFLRIEISSIDSYFLSIPSLLSYFEVRKNIHSRSFSRSLFMIEIFAIPVLILYRGQHTSVLAISSASAYGVQWSTASLSKIKHREFAGRILTLHCLYECANNGATHFLREYILTISNRSQTCRQANTQDNLGFL